MDGRLKALAKECVGSAAERFGDATDVSDDVLLGALAAEAIDAMLARVSDSNPQAFDSDSTKELKRVRKLLRRRIAEATPAEAEDVSTINSKPAYVGQYATSVDALGDEKRIDRFARLMGGGKASSRADGPTTFAVSPEEAAARQAQLQAQFEEAAARRGKLKGLGK
jgi:hypothetical protein